MCVCMCMCVRVCVCVFDPSILQTPTGLFPTTVKHGKKQVNKYIEKRKQFNLHQAEQAHTTCHGRLGQNRNRREDESRTSFDWVSCFLSTFLVVLRFFTFF